MKKAALVVLTIIAIHSQIKAQELETIYINAMVSTHFITSEPIQYVDISNDQVAGDMPIGNILRLKPKNPEDQSGLSQGIVTIVCQKYMVQYALVHADMQAATKSKFISSKDGQGLLLPAITISAEEMKSISSRLVNQPKKKPIQKEKNKGIKMMLNQIYTSGDHFFLDISIQNNTSISYEIDQLRFHVCDKKVIKATNSQQVELAPEFVLYTQHRIRYRYRNVLVFKKFTFPNEKVFEIEVSEKQLSGRTIKLQLDYRQILDAEPI